MTSWKKSFGQRSLPMCSAAVKCPSGHWEFWLLVIRDDYKKYNKSFKLLVFINENQYGEIWNLREAELFLFL